MPRQRKIVTEKLDPKALQEHSIARNIKLHRPYEVVAGALVARDEDKYYVVYRAPRGGDRKVIAERSVFANAVALRDILSEAWAQGFSSSGRE